jgi:hypothetical protein
MWRECRDVVGGGADHDTRGRVCHPDRTGGELNDSLSGSGRSTVLLKHYGQHSIKVDHYGNPTTTIDSKGTPPLCSPPVLGDDFHFCRYGVTTQRSVENGWSHDNRGARNCIASRPFCFGLARSLTTDRERITVYPFPILWQVSIAG